MKTCTKCGITKLISEFPWRTDRNMPYSRCKDCHREIMTIYNRSDSHKLSCRKWQRTESGKIQSRASCARFRKTAAFKKAIEKHRKKYPEKRAAQIILMNALRTGKIPKPGFCSMCKKQCNPEGHHSDYSKPLEVIWVCKSCHAAFHWSS